MPYALGGSTSFFWVAHRSGSFEKHGLKVLPIFMRGGREAVQALISRDVSMLQQGSSGVILAKAGIQVTILRLDPGSNYAWPG